MYVTDKISAIEQWHKEQGVPLLQAKNSEDVMHQMELSQYPVERAFNYLTVQRREMLKAVADIEPSEDYIRPDLSGDKLCHYNDKGISKLARGLRDLTELRRSFPQSIRLADFYDIDPHTRGQ
ncbi:MAG: hypothetical protein E6485_05965 [Haemophilus parainfluenzae]|jgi:uncharacterized 14.1 kDa protein in cox-rep intergenic region|nr:hypothetical protein [Haemophilus parainfluenzae]